MKFKMSGNSLILTMNDKENLLVIPNLFKTYDIMYAKSASS